jgi:L-lactate dehydrogenase
MASSASSGVSGPARVAIVGAGNVGATFAFALVLSGLAAEIVLIDVNRTRAEGEVMDLNHAVPFAQPASVWAGDYRDCAGADVTVIAAGVAQQPGESRIDLLRRNAGVFSQIVPQVARYNPDGIILVATNPVDIQTHVAWRLSGLPSSRVIGSGTILDTARFRYLLSQHFQVDPRSVHAYIIGEHGDSEVPVWSLANIAGMRLHAYTAANGLDWDQQAMDEVFRETREAAYRIIKLKGATYYAVAAGLVRIVESILRNQRTVLSVSSLVQGFQDVHDICLSLPTVIDRGGVERVLHLDLSASEAEAFRRSAEMLKQTAAELDLPALTS